MKLRSLALAALLSISLGAQAALETYLPWENAYSDQGLSGVLFKVSSNDFGTVALGAHGYKNGASLTNNGIDTFVGQSGIYVPDGLNRANWSFDFGFRRTEGCVGCRIYLGIDRDASTGVDLLFNDISDYRPNPESLNMEMDLITLMIYDFDPFASSSTAFALQIRDDSGVVNQTSITVNVGEPGTAVPEPGTLALLGLSLLGLAGIRLRKT